MVRLMEAGHAFLYNDTNRQTGVALHVPNLLVRAYQNVESAPFFSSHRNFGASMEPKLQSYACWSRKAYWSSKSNLK
jgi:hypothetical protein